MQERTEVVKDYSHWEMCTIKDMVKYGRDKGLFLVSDSESISRAIFFALKGLEYPWSRNLTGVKLEKSVSVLVDVSLKGVSK